MKIRKSLTSGLKLTVITDKGFGSWGPNYSALNKYSTLGLLFIYLLAYKYDLDVIYLRKILI